MLDALISHAFPFLFGGTFIEGNMFSDLMASLRRGFPFLFGGTFIEGDLGGKEGGAEGAFPFLFGGTFIEGCWTSPSRCGSLRISLPFRRDFH